MLQKKEQREMENSFIDHNLIKNVNQNKKANVLLNTRKFYKGRRCSLLLKKIYFHCLNHMSLVKMNGNKNILVMKNICQNLLS